MRKSISPADVEVAIEIMSPGSVTEDRIMKPAQYASVGILSYWRVETDDELNLSAYILRPNNDVYTPIGHWVEGEEVEIHEPFEVRFAVDELRG